MLNSLDSSFDSLRSLRTDVHFTLFYSFKIIASSDETCQVVLRTLELWELEERASLLAQQKADLCKSKKVLTFFGWFC